MWAIRVGLPAGVENCCDRGRMARPERGDLHRIEPLSELPTGSKPPATGRAHSERHANLPGNWESGVVLCPGVK